MQILGINKVSNNEIPSTYLNHEIIESAIAYESKYVNFTSYYAYMKILGVMR